MKKVVLLTSAILLAGYSYAGIASANAKEAQLKLVTMLPAKTSIGKSFTHFIKEFNTKFKGRIKLDWRGGPEIIKQFKQPNAVRLGSVDATLTSPSYANGILGVSGSANYSNKQYADIKSSGYLDLMTKLHASKGLVYVGELPVSDLRFHIFLKKPIKTIADLKGMKLRVFPSIAPAIKALGGNPIVLPMTEIYTAMERGIVDGFVSGVSGTARRFSDVLGAYVDHGFYRATFHFLVNPKAWAKVPADVQSDVIKYVRNANPESFEAVWAPELKAGYGILKNKGIKAVKFSAAEEAQFQKTVLEAAWNAVKKKSPKDGPTLQKMLMK
jgi:TRAP-type transport system periplasmic protein